MAQPPIERRQQNPCIFQTIHRVTTIIVRESSYFTNHRLNKYPMIRKNFVSLQMQRSTKLVFLLLVTAVLFLGTGCSASKKNSCGCPNKKGMVGY
jgi:hypothetical protein